MRTEDVLSVQELINYTKSIEDACFRGQADASCELIPSIYRELNNIPEDEAQTFYEAFGEIERDIYREFTQRARPYIKNVNIDIENIWERLSLAQHYGTPTRLLDWTSALTTAVYFAVSGADDTDAAVWCLDLSRLPTPPRVRLSRPIDRGRGYRLEVLPVANLSFGQIISEPFIAGKNPSTEYAVDDSFCTVFQPPDIDTRIKNQAGLFSVYISFGSDHPDHFVWNHSRYFRDLEAKTGETILHKLVIPKAKRAQFRRDLRQLGVDTKLIFPDLVGLGMYLKAFRSEHFALHKKAMKRKGTS